MKEVIAEQFNLVAFACLCTWKEGGNEATLFWVNCVLIISLITNPRCYFYAKDLVSHFRAIRWGYCIRLLFYCQIVEMTNYFL